MILSSSAKTRLVIQSTKAVQKLESRLATCEIADFAHVKRELATERAALITLMEMPVKPKRERK